MVALRVLLLTARLLTSHVPRNTALKIAKALGVHGKLVMQAVAVENNSVSIRSRQLHPTVVSSVLKLMAQLTVKVVALEIAPLTVLASGLSGRCSAPNLVVAART